MDREALSFSNPGELESWLRESGVDTSSWGAEGRKSVQNLWDETQSGDCRLLAGPLRVVDVARVVIRREDKVLHEVGQEFVNNTRRDRDWPPSEKIRPDQTPRDAAERCLQDELERKEGQYRIMEKAHGPEVVERNSPSYPGLPTEYHFFDLEADAPTLPDGEFSTQERSSGPGEPVRTHWWRWV